MCVVPCTRQTAASITTSRQDIIVRAFIWVGVQIECADPTNQHPRLKDASSPCLPTFKMCFYLKETCLPQIGCGAKVPIVMIMDAWWYNSTQLKCVREFLAFAGGAYVLVVPEIIIAIPHDIEEHENKYIFRSSVVVFNRIHVRGRSTKVLLGNIDTSATLTTNPLSRPWRTQIMESPGHVFSFCNAQVTLNHTNTP